MISKSLVPNSCSLSRGNTLRITPTATIADPGFQSWLDAVPPGPTPDELSDFYQRLRDFTFVGQSNSNSVPAPPCKKQGDYRSIGGMFSQFTDDLHVRGLRAR